MCVNNPHSHGADKEIFVLVFEQVRGRAALFSLRAEDRPLTMLSGG